MQVGSLLIYPVKSLGHQSLTSVVVEARGLRGDRRLMVVDANGVFITQREIAQLVLISAQWQGNALCLRHGNESCVVPPYDAQCQQQYSPKRVRVWNDNVDAVDLGDDVAAALSRWVGKDVRLVYMGDDCLRQVDLAYGNTGDIVSFADGYPVLLIGAASIAQFNSTLSAPVTAMNFRPNIVVENSAAFAEDGWQRVRIGEVVFDIVKPCSRCVVPSINPATAQKNAEITRALATHRRGVDGKTYFGQNLIARGAGTISVGDVVEVLA